MIIKKIIKYSLIFTGFISFSLLIYSVIFSNFNDISVKPINKIHLKNSKKTNHNTVYLVSYADGHESFFRNQLALCESALGRGVDVLMNYNRSMIDKEFLQKNKEIFKHKQGAGLWLWKPWAIYDAMKKASENSIIIYSDTGFVFKNSLYDLINFTNEKDMVVVEYEDRDIYPLFIDKVKREVLIKMDIDNEKYHYAPPVIGGFMVIKNNEKSRSIIKEWLDLCQIPGLLIGGPSSKPELPGFSGHQHDQSIFRMVAFKHRNNIKNIAYGSVLEKKYTSWHHRRPGANPDDDMFIYKSLKPYYSRYRKIVRAINLLIYNNYFIKKFRKNKIESK